MIYNIIRGVLLSGETSERQDPSVWVSLVFRSNSWDIKEIFVQFLFSFCIFEKSEDSLTSLFETQEVIYMSLGGFIFSWETSEKQETSAGLFGSHWCLGETGWDIKEIYVQFLFSFLYLW